MTKLTRTRSGSLPARGGHRRLLDAFLSGRSPRTIEAYRRDLEDLRSYLGAADLNDTARMLLSQGPGEANATVLEYRAALKERGLAPATINRRLASVRSLVKLARTLGLVTWALEIRNVPTQGYRDTRGPGRQGFNRLLRALERDGRPKAIRDRAIVRLLHDLALRRGEVASLDLEHLHLDDEPPTISIMGKGRTERESLTVPEPTVAALRDWIEKRGDHPGPLFTNFDRAGKGERLSTTSVYRMVRKLGVKVGVKARPHGLRHAAITEALDLTGGDVRAVQRFSRHRDLRVLNVYDDAREDLGGEVARRVAEGT